MSRFGEFFARGRSALLAGQATYDRPPVEGSRRWGAAAVLRPCLVHFAAPVERPEAIVGWCEERADLTVGVAELSRAEIVRAVHTGGGVRLVTLERAECGP
ncbi:hypothetical protein [Nonomuraea dietziae]|uniref:hypothetical protein n=1 Tax=Nonomuraea dietziae TaxID=65515 RepID=UPI0034025068